ncbi:MAG: transcriptional regulator [Clostridia bacterium]|nr:transcriptional regulator [Clostridia bacterium]
MAFDYKKECKEFYAPGRKPELVTVPAMTYIAVRGQGDPNEENGEYQRALGLLYGVAYTIKMSRKGPHRIEGYFDYVVPPLEGFWWQDESGDFDLSRKADLQWISAIRVPEFVTPDEFSWAVAEAAAKKKTDFSDVHLIDAAEGLCVQCLHVGPYDLESATVSSMEDFMQDNRLAPDLTPERRHHEIYLSDPRRTVPERLKTVLRIPVRRT